MNRQVPRICLNVNALDLRIQVFPHVCKNVLNEHVTSQKKKVLHILQIVIEINFSLTSSTINKPMSYL
jgi:hypothetical protein